METTTTQRFQEQEEQDFGTNGLLWDANPEVCCAAFQLGACQHTEYAFDDDYCHKAEDEIEYADEYGND